MTEGDGRKWQKMKYNGNDDSRATKGKEMGINASDGKRIKKKESSSQEVRTGGIKARRRTFLSLLFTIMMVVKILTTAHH